MQWIHLISMSQLETIKKKSFQKTVLIFKHSTTCSISSISLNRLERNWRIEDTIVETYYLDLLNHYDISNQIAIDFKIEHQSPQVLIIRNAKVIYEASHFEIEYATIETQIRQQSITY